jgi:DNA-binding NarL/FixJ family response regulator
MPAFDSTAALAQVREAAPKLPFFVYSGDLTRDQATRALNHGADGVLEKRDTSGLLRVIGEALGQHGVLPA